MTKMNNQRTIEFTQDYATKKAGDVISICSMVASELVRREKVAKFVETISKPDNKKKNEKIN